MGEEGTVSRQFSFKSLWDRATRMAVVAIGAITALGKVPETAMEWIGVTGAVLGASYTGR